MRILLPAAVLGAALAPVPALAGEAQRVVEEMNDPARQEQIAAAAEGIAEAVMAMPAGPLLRAAETMAGRDPEAVDPDLRVGDLVGPEAADAPREMARRMPAMMGAMASLAGAMDAMLPELRALGDRIAEDMAEVGARTRDDY